MTKEGIKIQCQNCLYWDKGTVVGRCMNANNPYYLAGYRVAITSRNHICEWFWPKPEYRK